MPKYNSTKAIRMDLGRREVVINVEQDCGSLWLHLGMVFRISITG